jgi:hypothetical protein
MNIQNGGTVNAPELESPKIPVALDNGIIPIEYLAVPVVVTFPVWPAATTNQTYQLLWDNERASGEKYITETDKPGDLLQLEIPVNLLTEGDHTVSYRTFSVNSEFENRSESTPIQIDRTAAGAPLLAPILFPDVIQDGLTSAELDALNNVLPGKIASYSAMSVGDVVRTSWGALVGPTATVSANDMGLNRVMVDFNREFLAQADGTQAAVSYTVTDLAGNVSMQAEPVLVQLRLSEVVPLPLPVIVEAKDGTLNPANTSNGATLEVNASANLRAGDIVVAKWDGPKASDQKEKVISAQEAGNALSLVFSSALVSANDGQQVSVSYRVTRTSGVVQDSEVLTLSVLGNLSIDTSPVTLAGKIYLLPAYPLLLPAFPADTTVQRTATGGVAPYTYSSSNPAVAQVDAEGLVSVRGNGGATISVVDAAGQTGAYQVTVTGVIQCIGLGMGKFLNIHAAAGNNGARLPSIHELREIHGAYGNRWLMGNNNYWSSTVAKQLTPFGTSYYVKNLVGGGEVDAYTFSHILGVGLR